MLSYFFFVGAGMELYTIQLGQWRRAKEQGILVLDTTWRNGDVAFSPIKDIVHGYKYSGMSEEQYTFRYHELLDEKIVEHRKAWDHLITLPKVAVACMCRAGVFCHRHVLVPRIVSYGEGRGVVIEYKGEL